MRFINLCPHTISIFVNDKEQILLFKQVARLETRRIFKGRIGGDFIRDEYGKIIGCMSFISFYQEEKECHFCNCKDQGQICFDDVLRVHLCFDYSFVQVMREEVHVAQLDRAISVKE